MAGRKKIEMKKLADKKSRQVTFSKRRSGLFKKANELAMLCAAQMAIVVFSLTGKPYSFGHPNVNVVVQRFLNDQENKANVQHVDDDDAKDDGVVQELNEELNNLLEQLQMEKERGKQLDKSLKADRATCKYDKPIIQLNMDELSDMKIDLQKLQENVKGHLSEMVASSSLLLLNEHGDKSEN